MLVIIECLRGIYLLLFLHSTSTFEDKVAQLVRCRTSNQRVAGSIPGRGTLVCPWARQFIPYCFSLPSCKMGYLALIRQCLELVCYMLPAALEIFPGGLKMISVCTVPARGGRSCERFGGYKSINRIPLFDTLPVLPTQIYCSLKWIFNDSTPAII